MRLRHYTFVDCATQGYLALTGLVILACHGDKLPGWPRLLAAHALAIGLIHALIRSPAAQRGSGGLDFLRHFYPVLLFAGLYRETAALNHLFVAGFLDPWFIRLDARIFGLQPSVAFMAALPFWPVSEFFYAAYFSYYVMIGGIGVALYLRNREQFFHYLSVVSFVFYACYLTYIVLPVVGPRSLDPPFPAAVEAGPFAHLMAWIYRIFEGPGAAFPSSHVAVAIATVYFSFRYLRPIRWAHLGAAILLCLATVYCRYHYAVDVAGGALAAAVLIPSGNWLHFRFTQSSRA